MQTIKIIIDLALAGLVAYFAYNLVTRYRAAAGTFKDRLLAAGHDSATILIQRLVAVTAGLVAVVPTLADVLGATGVSSAVQSIIPGGLAPYYMVVLSIITELARRRTGGGGLVAGN